jgi:hypothetical protein
MAGLFQQAGPPSRGNGNERSRGHCRSAADPDHAVQRLILTMPFSGALVVAAQRQE